MNGFLLDLRQSLRRLLKSSGFVVVAVIALGFGIAINSSVFTLLNAVALRPLPVDAPSNLITIYQIMRGLRERGVHGDQSLFSLPEYVEYRDQSHVFSSLAAFANAQLTLGGNEPRPLTGDLVTCNFFEALTGHLSLGRGFSPNECTTPGGAVVVVSERLWRHEFGSDPQILGKPMVLNGKKFTIVGVAPAGFNGASLFASDVWAPLSMQAQWIPGREFLNDANLSWLQLIGRLKPGVSLAEARADLAVIAKRIDQQNPPRTTILQVDRAALMNLPQGKTVVLGAGAVVLAAVSLVLLIACANLANLLIARAAARQKEIGMRLALGATRQRLVIQMLTESIVVSLTAGALGLFASWMTMRALFPIIMANLPAEAPALALNLSPDLTILGYLVALSVLTGIGFGLLPALHATRIDLNWAVRESGALFGIHRSRIHSGLVAVQIAVCLVLLIAAGLLTRGLHAAQTIDPGFDMKNIVAATFDLSRQGYDRPRSAAFHRTLADRMAARGVEFAFVEPVPLSGNRFGTVITPEGRDQPVQIFYATVSPNYFRFLQIPIVAGIAFEARNLAAVSNAAIVSESTARRLWPGENPIGKRFHFGRESTFKEVSGVAKDVRSTGLAQTDDTFVYVLQGRDEYAGSLLVRNPGNGASAARAILDEAHSLDATVLVRAIGLEQNLTLWEFAPRITATLGAVLGIAGLLLASIGIYGVVSHAVTQQTKEIGIRMSLGANPNDVLRMMIRQIMLPVAFGGLAGLIIIASVSRILQSLLFGVSPVDPLVFGGVSLLLAGVAFLASYAPARRATRIDPMLALHNE
jgi:putative ABC transport system permease protein